MLFLRRLLLLSAAAGTLPVAQATAWGGLTYASSTCAGADGAKVRSLSSAAHAPFREVTPPAGCLRRRLGYGKLRDGPVGLRLHGARNKRDV